MSTKGNHGAGDVKTAYPTYPEWMDLKSAQQYACVSERTLREWIHLASNPLPASQVGKKILIHRSDFDRWLDAHRVGCIDVAGMVNEIVASVVGPH